MLALSYWVVPIISATVWAAMLVTMVSYWAAKGHPHYSEMNPKQWFPYISDIAAHNLKPMFIAMCSVTVVTFDLAFIFERYLRHTGTLHRNTSAWQKLYSACSIVCAIIGAAGLILLSIFDNVNHNRLHNIFLAVFIIGYIVSAIFICWEYQRLGIHYREHSILAYSFWIKLTFILLEIALCIVFGVAQKTHHPDIAAAFEWTVAFVYTFYVLSFSIDFLPAVRSKHYQSHETEMQMAEEAGPRMMGDREAESGQYFRGSAAPMPLSDGSERYAANGNGYANGYTNGNGFKPQQ